MFLGEQSDSECHWRIDLRLGSCTIKTRARLGVVTPSVVSACLVVDGIGVFCSALYLEYVSSGMETLESRATYGNQPGGRTSDKC